MNKLLASIVAPIIVGTVVNGILTVSARLIVRATPVNPGESRLNPIYGATGVLSGVFAGLIFGIGVVSGDMSPARHDYWAWLSLLAAFLAFGLYFTIASGNWRMWRTETGLQIRNELGVTGPFTRWDQIAKVRTKWTSVVVFEIRGGGTRKIPFFTEGLIEAVAAAHAHGASVNDALLQQMREGLIDHRPMH